MRATFQCFLLGACLASAVGGPAKAQVAAAAAPPGSVEARLQSRDFRYEVDEDGDFKIVLSWQKEARSQLVYVAGKADQAGDLAIRQVFAPAASLEGAGLSPEALRALLRDNARRALGHWAINDSHLLYVINVPDDIDAQGLETAINVAAEAADGKELELTGDKDAF
ncbi:YbjN domain-containing protein [Luteimonas vadosa]|uniref:Peptidase n=1 Tax=Luteimonas vadosa TaxID=1165507 RepID=A0ABP9E0A7_9GAMM